MQKDSNWWQGSLSVFLRMSYWISAPVLVGIFLGRWLDRRYDSEPWLFLLCTGLSFVFSMVGLIKTAYQEFNKSEKGDSKIKKNQDDEADGSQ